MFLSALAETGRDTDLKDNKDIFWNTLREDYSEVAVAGKPRPIYGAEDVDSDRWTLLHWASYNGSAKVRRLLLLKGADQDHLSAIELEENPTLLMAKSLEGIGGFC